MKRTEWRGRYIEYYEVINKEFVKLYDILKLEGNKIKSAVDEKSFKWKANKTLSKYKKFRKYKSDKNYDIKTMRLFYQRLFYNLLYVAFEMIVENILKGHKVMMPLNLFSFSIVDSSEITKKVNLGYDYKLRGQKLIIKGEVNNGFYYHAIKELNYEAGIYFTVPPYNDKDHKLDIEQYAREHKMVYEKIKKQRKYELHNSRDNFVEAESDLQVEAV